MDLKSNEPFWLIKNGLPASYPSLRTDASCDVLIVGGGITGSLMAHQCIADGYDTLLTDKREVCNGSTSATTSMLQYEIDTPLYRLSEMIGKKGAASAYSACSDAIDLLKEITGKIGSASGFMKKDSLYFASAKRDIQWLKKEFEARKEQGYVVEWMSAEEIIKRYDITDTYGGILSVQGGSVDAFRLAHELLAYNAARGLRVYDKTTIAHAESRKGGVRITTTEGFRINARRVVYCTGYESVQMIPEKFVNLLSSFAVVSEVESELYEKYKNLLIWNTDQPYLYMRTTDDGRFLVGGEDVPFRDPVKRDALIGKKQKKLVGAFHRLFPEKRFYPDFAWAGTFGETKDGLPYIGAHQNFDNTYFVLGFGGNGITFSVTGMEMVSRWLKGKKHLLTPYFAFGR